MTRKALTMIACLLLSGPCCAQEDVEELQSEEPAGYKLKLQVYRYAKPLVEEGDTMWCYLLPELYVYPPLKFKSEKQRRAYNRLVYNVKKVLPIAKEVNRAVLETYEYLQTLPDDKARKEHMKLVEKSLMAEYKPRMKKLTYSQGKLLIKLIYRETNSSSYELVQVFFGSTRASFYQAFAWVLGASLKKAYDPNGVDRLTERVVRQVESGQL